MTGDQLILAFPGLTFAFFLGLSSYQHEKFWVSGNTSVLVKIESPKSMEPVQTRWLVTLSTWDSNV